SGRIIRIAPKSPIVCATTTSTIPGGSTTTTSPSGDPCASLAGFDLARCRIAEAVRNPLCPAGRIDDGVASAVVGKLERVGGFVHRAAGAGKPRRVRKLLARADRGLARIPRPLRRAVHKQRMSDDCRVSIESLTSGLRSLLAPLVP